MHSRRLGLALVAFVLASAASTQEREPDRNLPGAPYTWLYDVDDLRSLPYIKALGLNTVYLQLSAPADAGELSFARVIIQEAEKLRLGVVVGLDTTMSENHSCSLDNAAYVDAVTEYITDAVKDLSEVPGVIGWATGSGLERDLVVSDPSFREYLRAKYGSFGGIEAAWGVDIPTDTHITAESAQAADDELPFSAGMPSIDLAEFTAQSYHEMMALWARLIREASGGEGVLVTGRIGLYRSLIAIPEEYDIIVASMPPWLLERDWETHNVQAIDIARRGGRRDAMPCLRLPHGLLDGETFSSGRLHEWMMEAAMHGAVGLSFIAPEEVIADRQVQNQLEEGLEWIADQPAWGTRPIGSAAILYEPYADGFVALETPAYGYIKGMSPREPSDLLNAFKQGTRYGAVEILSRDDLLDADIDRFGVILAPMALDIPDALQRRLAEYVSTGGVLVADIGFGSLQSGSWSKLPPRLGRLFGVEEFVEMRNMTGNLTVHHQHAIMPLLGSGARTTGDFEGSDRGRRTGGGPYSVNSWAGFAPLDDSVTAFLRLGMSVTDGGKPTFAGVIVRETGSGATLFATHRLWSAWMPGHGLWDAFHATLLERGARIELMDAPFIAPGVEAVECEDGSVTLYNPADGRRLQLALLEAGHRLLSGAVCQYSSRLIDPSGMRSGGVLATIDMPTHGSWRLGPTGVGLRPFAGIVTAALERNDDAKVQFLIGGAESVPVGDYGELRPSLGRPTRVRMTVTSGAYSIEPGSRHRITVRNDSGPAAEAVVVADDEREITTDINVSLARVTIAPATP